MSKTTSARLRLPVGVIGPLRVNGIFAKGDYYVPLATSEAALVASYGRGARLISSVGGCTTGTLAEGVHRSPGFAFATTTEAGLFVAWVCANFEMLKAAAETTTRHGKLVELSPHVEGDHVYLVCSYTTGDAAGQNMVTIATEACVRSDPRAFAGEAGLLVRGGQLLGRQEGVGDVVRWRARAEGDGVGGAAGRGNREAAAHDAEADGGLLAHVGAGRRDVGLDRRAGALRQRSGGALSGDRTGCGVRGGKRGGRDAHRAARRGPAVRLGNAAEHHRRDGGRRDGPADAGAGLNILGLKGAGNARAFGEVCAAVCLAGELSIIGALCAHEFASAHKNLARGKA